mgnify:CR=1 FL=1
MNRGFYIIMAAQFFSALADNALLIAAIAILRDMQAPAAYEPLLKTFFTVSYVALAAFVGALIVTATLVAFALRSAAWETHRMLLAGVAIASAAGAIVSVMLTIAPAAQLHGMLQQPLELHLPPLPAGLATCQRRRELAGRLLKGLVPVLHRGQLRGDGRLGGEVHLADEVGWLLGAPLDGEVLSGNGQRRAHRVMHGR